MQIMLISKYISKIGFLNYQSKLEQIFQDRNDRIILVHIVMLDNKTLLESTFIHYCMKRVTKKRRNKRNKQEQSKAKLKV